MFRKQTVVDGQHRDPAGLAQRCRDHAMTRRTTDGKCAAMYIKESPVVARTGCDHPLGGDAVRIGRIDFHAELFRAHR